MRSAGFLLAAFVCLPSAAAAQTAETGPTLKIGGYVQYDYLSPLGESAETEGTFRFRRVRLSLSGALAKHIDWSLTAEATTTPLLRDAFIAFTHLPAATVRVGQFVMPYGQEQYMFSSNTLAFTERLLVSMVPSRDAGIMISNAEPFGGWFTYAAALTNGTGQNVRDNNDAKDTMLRLTLTPPRVPGLRLSAGGVTGDQPTGRRTRRGGDISFERRAFHLAAEFIDERIDGARSREGYYVFGSRRLYPPAPRPFFHHIEFGSRLGRITGAAPSGQWEVSANYYVQANLRFMCDYIVHIDRAPDAPRRTFHARANFRF